MPARDKPRPSTDDLLPLGFVKDADGVFKFEDIEIPPPPCGMAADQAAKKRLIITHLKVRNFKSYAGEQVIGPFDKNFTAVVGPNGSGKSNVIDSLMFVFGHRATRIRAKKITALIHKSSLYKKVDSCTVTVYFAEIRDEDDGAIIPNSAFCISRTVRQDGSSFYEVNNKAATQKEVVRLLRRHGIDMEYCRFLILQGEIESISQMLPIRKEKDKAKQGSTSLLEYVEDIIGSNRFVEPIIRVKDRLVRLQEEVTSKAKALELVSTRVKEVETPRNEALAYLRKDNQRILCENALYQCQKQVSVLELNKLKKEKDVHEKKANAFKANMGRVHSEKKTLEKELSDLHMKFNDLVKKYEKYKEEFQKLEQEDARNTQNMKDLKKKIIRVRESKAVLDTEADKVEKQLITYQKETIELKEKKSRFVEEKDLAEKKAEELTGSIKKESAILQEKKEKLENTLIDLKKNCFDIKSDIDVKQSELKILLSGETKEKDKLSALMSEYERNKDEAAKEVALLNSEKELIVQLEKDVPLMKQQLSNAKQNELSLSQQLREERLKLDEAKNTQQTSQSSSGLLKRLLKEKAEGRITGIYGRLGDLGGIDEKYDVAISTACGRLDNIVTNNISTAQKCVEFLKKYNLGYATFIALDEMKKYESYVHQKRTYPENVPRLLDLVRVKDASLLPAFYYALGDTLVARDLEQATRIGLQGRERHRMVTIKGEVIDLAGTMSGGGGRSLKGRMGQSALDCSFSQEDLARMSASVEAFDRKWREVKQLLSNLEEEISEKCERLSALKRSVKKREMNCKAYKEQVGTLASQTASQQQKITETTIDEKRVKNLEKEIELKNKNYASAKQDTSKVESEIFQLQEEILKISKGKVEIAKRGANQAVKKLDDVDLCISKSTVNIKQSTSKLNKLNAKLRIINKDLEEKEKAFADMRESQSTNTTRGIEMVERNNKYRDEVLPAEKEKQNAVKRALEGVNEREHELKREDIEQKNNLKTLEAKESEIKAIIKSFNNKLAKLELNEVEGETFAFTTLTDEEMERRSIQELSAQVELYKQNLAEQQIDLSAIAEYKKQMAIFEEKENELNAGKRQMALEKQRSDALEKIRLNDFYDGFKIIAIKLKEIYRMLTLGGDAEIESFGTPFETGVEMSIRPPKKSWKVIRHLSGGEKTLGSLALVFALHHYRPTPFYVMDEIDAALDVRNVAIVGFFLKERTKNAQFIIVSLRNVMNELSDNLLGIYKVNNCTKNISFNCQKWAVDCVREAEERARKKNQENQGNEMVNGGMNGVVVNGEMNGGPSSSSE